MQNIEINSQFNQVLNFINQTNQSVFLTGKAGTGKTTLLKYIKQNTYKQSSVVAPTGVAAINAGGSTIHSFFQFAFTPFVPFFKENGHYDFAKMSNHSLKYTSQRLNIMRQLELLVIDEISMVRCDLLDQIDYTLRVVRKKWDQAFGGVQVLFIGDMHQLPPVAQQEEWKLLEQYYPGPFFFNSYVIQQFRPAYIELSKIYRQSEQTFVSLLNKVRNNQMDEESLKLLNSRYNPNITEHDYQNNITLTTHNKKADEINSKNMAALLNKAQHYKAKVDGIFSEKNYPVDEDLELKVGARVMFLKNNPEKNYYNGKIGLVTFLDSDKVKVKCEEDKSEIEVTKETWQNVSYKLDNASKQINEEVLGTFSQLPLRYAWAITIHKSQGLTFDKLIIDAAESFSAGQVYVALSRCRSLNGLTLSSKIQTNALFNDKSILNFSQQKLNEHDLEQTFFDSKKTYLNTILSELFDFEQIIDLEIAFQKAIHAFSKKLNADAHEWAQALNADIRNLYDVSKKFHPQLNQLLQSPIAYEQNNQLQSRLMQASNYYYSKTSDILYSFKECKIVTESKEAANELNELLQQLQDDLFVKNYYFEFCKQGFDFTEFVKHKLKINYPQTKINVYANLKNLKIGSDVPHPKLFRKLVLLRDQLCNDEMKPIYLVASNKTITELCKYLPTNKEELNQISGFGEAKIEAFGDQFLTLIRNYLIENELESTMAMMPVKKKKSASKKKKEIEHNDYDVNTVTKINTKEATFNMFKENFSIEEIAAHRKLSIATIQNHLIPFIANNEIQISKLVPEQKQKLILKALENFKNEHGLAYIKTKLPDDVSFAEIRFVLASKLANSDT